jgi:hypothetical protein
MKVTSDRDIAAREERPRFSLAQAFTPRTASQRIEPDLSGFPATGMLG